MGVPCNQLLIVETDGNIDTYMELYDDRLNLLSENDDFGESLNARIDYPAESGTHYIIKVKGLSESDVGSYRFRASVTAFSDRDEPNDRQNQATLLTPDSSHTGYFSSATDVDWYRVQMPSKGGVLTAYVNGSSRSDLSIVDQTGQIVKNSGGSSYISAIVPGGTIYLQLKERNNWRGRYEISVEIYDAQPLDRYEPDDDMNSAGEIFMDVSQQHTFSYSGDVDWVRFTVSRAGAYEIRTMGINRDVDTYIELFDSRGNSVAEDDDGGENLDSRLQIQLRPGTYFLKVAAYEEDPVNQSDYEISVAPVRF
ncbi:hypothetical protein FACS1894164_21410 [Spirochaetia bacterium]|nr:hypothetical protein FACS1894164_21410 [Spirochaetia bacterium]